MFIDYHHNNQTEDIDHHLAAQDKQENLENLPKSDKSIKRRNTSSKWTVPITSEGSSEDMIRGTAEQILNPALENSKMLSNVANNVLPKGQNGTGKETRTFQKDRARSSDKHLKLEKLNVICENVVADLNNYGVCVVDNFLGPVGGDLVLNEVLNIYNAGLFSDGQLVSTKAGSNDTKNIRGDEIVWLDGKETNCPNIGRLISQVDAIIIRANKMENNGKLGTYTITGRTKVIVH